MFRAYFGSWYVVVVIVVSVQVCAAVLTTLCHLVVALILECVDRALCQLARDREATLLCARWSFDGRIEKEG